MKQRILEGAHALFVQHGVRSVSMDDVAKALSMSKKTLYLHFTNKDELVTQVVNMHLDTERDEFGQIAEISGNSIEELFNLSKCLRQHAFRINPSLLHDLQKYHMEAWAVFQKFKKDFIKKQITENIRRGVSEGYYREGLNADILAILRMEVIQLAFSDEVFPRARFDFLEVQMNVFDHFVHGLLSEKGKKLYQHYQTQEKSLSK